MCAPGSGKEERYMFWRASPFAVCHQSPRKVVNEPLCAVTTALADLGGVTSGKTPLGKQ